MPLHSRRPPAPPDPEFFIADPVAPRPTGTPTTPAEPTAPTAPTAAVPAARTRAPDPVTTAPPARREPTRRWHQGEPWAVAMLASFAIVLVAIFVPGQLKLALIGLSALAAVAGIVMLARRGLFDEPTSRDD